MYNSRASLRRSVSGSSAAGTLEPVLDVRQLEAQTPAGELVRPRTHALASPPFECRSHDAYYLEHFCHLQEWVFGLGHRTMSNCVRGVCQRSDGRNHHRSFADFRPLAGSSDDQVPGVAPGRLTSLALTSLRGERPMPSQSARRQRHPEACPAMATCCAFLPHWGFQCARSDPSGAERK